MAAPKKQPTEPVLRVAPLGELRIYPVYEYEFEALGRGSPASLFLNFSLALLPTAAGIAVTLGSSTTSDLNFVVFTCIGVIFALVGLICLFIWWRLHSSARTLMQDIKNRMPPSPRIQKQADEAGQTEPPASAT
jgi:hypothetical protein